jgi:leucyl-tRNA synthetase
VPRYNPAEIEPRWQRIWEQNQTFRTPDDPSLEKYYVLDMFPYPSGEGLHVGHPEGYTATDILARFQRMKGKAVLHPMGFDAFGLPAEEAAIKRNVPPREFTEKNIANFKRQLKMLGFSYDWDRQISTTDIPYVRWTQWIFLQLYDTWFDEQSQRGRPIAELPIPAEISARGEAAIAEYQDSFRLAYEGDALVNWCPALGTVLANEEVVDGRSEHGHAVQRIPLRQWMLRITSYAERLEKDLEQVDWPEGIKKLQRDWIGRSTGAEVDFLVGDLTAFDQWTKSRKASGFPRTAEPNVLRVYTTRPDTLFGATYMVIAPEHPLVSQITTSAQAAAVEAYCSAAASKSDRDRQDDKKSKTGVFTGTFAINPLTRKPIPIWIADYVLINYGTGAIMAVPAHDNRDFEFARQFELPIVAVVKPTEKNTDVDWPSVLAGASCFSGEGIATNSGTFDGLATEEFKTKIKQQLSSLGIGREAVNFKLRDWLFSRQRFWGEPFPILHELDDAGKPTGRKRAVPADSLPVDLPHLDDFNRREINTMPQWAGSCWYYLRFIDPRNEKAVVNRELEKRWMPVDLYVGGAEHAVLHLLYARFWHKVLFDRGVVSTVEPFKKLVNQGMILGEMEFTGYRDSTEKWVSSDLVIEAENNALVLARDKSPVVSVKLDPDQVEKSGEKFVLKSDPSIRIDSRAYKMSKSRGNVINPDEIVADYGADSLRLYEMFMGPLEASKPWSMAGVNGVRGFLDRVWRMIIDDRAETKTLNESIVDTAPTDEQLRVLHKTIKAVSQDIENLSFNTAIARLMEFVNYFTKQSARPRSIMSKFILILSPLAPHIAEELWAILGHKQTLAYEPWPTFDESLTVDQSVEIPISIQGKLRSKINIARGMSNDEVEKIALLDERIAELLVGKTVKKVIIVPDRMVNIVAN